MKKRRSNQPHLCVVSLWHHGTLNVVSVGPEFAFVARNRESKTPES